MRTPEEQNRLNDLHARNPKPGDLWCDKGSDDTLVIVGQLVSNDRVIYTSDGISMQWMPAQQFLEFAPRMDVEPGCMVDFVARMHMAR